MTKRNILLGIAIPMAINAAIGMPVGHGYETLTEPIDTVSLQEVTVTNNFVRRDYSPLRVTTISSQDIKARSTRRTFPEMMQGTPGLFATAETGSYGDAKLNIRGFKQENIGVLLNGIPIQGLTSGSMYWSNWMGLQDATFALQLQKGIGANMLTDCAMGGSVNIQTINSNLDPRTEFSLSAQQYGLFKGTLTYQSGELPNGWSVSTALSYTKGDGYVQQTGVEVFSYMLTVAKRINSNHTLMFTALGSPEEHDQRNTKLTAAEVAKYGNDYNKNWGYLNGKAFSLSRNHYHKPYFTLQHIMSTERLNMRNSVYMALANGGGRWNESQAKSIAKYQTAEGLIDFDGVLADNLTWSGADAHPEYGKSAQNIITDYQSGHIQAGAISSMDYRLSEAWKLGAGLQYQYYRTYEQEEILDLLGADYWYEDYGKRALCGANGRSSIKRVGDMIRRDNGRKTHMFSAYLSAEYSTEKLTATMGASLFQGNYQRRDHYNYVDGKDYSDWAHGVGFGLKAGLLYNVTRNTAFYANLGYNSRLPYANVYFASGTLEITKDVKNETNLMAELGYRQKWHGGSLELGGYIARWGNKTLQSAAYRQQDADAVKYQITGLNALHMGIEFNIHQQFSRWLSASFFASLANWKWKNDVSATIYDVNTDQVQGTVNVYADGLHVGDAPQTQLGGSLRAQIPGGLYASLEWQMNGRMYADFEPSSRTNPDDRSDAYRIPTYHVLNGGLGWKGNINSRTAIEIFVNGTNLTNASYLERATDGAKHDLQSVTGFWSQARLLSCGMRLSF